jgi:phage protein D
MPTTSSATPSTVAQRPVRPARPTISLDGQRQTKLEASLVRYELTDSLDGMAHAELCFGNWGGGDSPGFQYFDRKLLEFGKLLKVSLGGDPLFEGPISAIAAEYPEGATPEIRVHAEDRLQALRMTRRSRVFERVSLGGIARRVASDHGLTPEISVEGEAAPVIAQLNQSDLAFLIDLARAADAEVRAVGDRLVVERGGGGLALGLAWAGSLRRFEVMADLAHQRGAIVASGWDVAARAGVSHRADVSVIRGEIGNDEAGGDILARTLGDRTDTLAHGCPATAAEARQLAEASYRHAARSFVTGEGLCETDPRLRVGAVLELSGLGPLFDGRYRAIAVSHLFDPEEGARSAFRCDRPGLGRP